ncbi:MAG: DUF370 domain-containing protein [Clostridiales bacterium]|nr:DUF370 domain-containing protein [Clostridiales bacterium]
MYVHIGAEHIVEEKKIIGIFDMDTATVAKQTKKWLKEKAARGQIVQCSRDIPKSLLVCEDRLLMCDLNPATIKGRITKNNSGRKQANTERKRQKSKNGRDQ